MATSHFWWSGQALRVPRAFNVSIHRIASSWNPQNSSSSNASTDGLVDCNSEVRRFARQNGLALGLARTSSAWSQWLGRVRNQGRQLWRWRASWYSCRWLKPHSLKAPSSEVACPRARLQWWFSQHRWVNHLKKPCRWNSESWSFSISECDFRTGLKQLLKKLPFQTAWSSNYLL